MIRTLVPCRILIYSEYFLTLISPRLLVHYKLHYLVCSQFNYIKGYRSFFAIILAWAATDIWLCQLVWPLT